MMEDALEKRILSGKVNVYDAMEYAKKNGLKCESWDEIQRATQEIYANMAPKKMHMPGTGNR